jgi:hypothetical protein
MALVAGSATRGSFDYPAWFGSTASLRADILECLVVDLNQGVPLYCQAGVPSWDLTAAVKRAMDRGASFTNYLEFVPATEATTPFYSLQPTVPAVEVTGATTVQRTADGYHLAGLTRLRVKLAPVDPTVLKSCRVLEVKVMLRSSDGATVHVLWATPDHPYSGIASRPDTIPGAVFSAAWFSVSSSTGFGPWVWILITPDPASVDLQDVEMRCRLQM